MPRWYTEHRRIHAAWTIGVLIVLLGINLILDFGSRPEISNILTFAVGFTSLFVGLVAIAQSQVTTIRNEQTNASIQTAVGRLSDPVDELRSLSSSIINRLEAIGARTEFIEHSVKNSPSFREQNQSPVTGSPNSPFPESLIYRASPVARAALLGIVVNLDKIDISGIKDGEMIPIKMMNHEADNARGLAASLSTFSSLGFVEIVFYADRIEIEQSSNIRELMGKKESLKDINPDNVNIFRLTWEEMFPGSPSPI